MTQLELNQIIGAVSMQKQAAYGYMYKQASDDEENELTLERLRKAKIGPGAVRTAWSGYWPRAVSTIGGGLAGGLLGYAGGTAMGDAPFMTGLASAAGAVAGAGVGNFAGNFFGANNVASNQTKAIAEAIVNGDIKVDRNGNIRIMRKTLS